MVLEKQRFYLFWNEIHFAGARAKPVHRYEDEGWAGLAAFLGSIGTSLDKIPSEHCSVAFTFVYGRRDEL